MAAVCGNEVFFWKSQDFRRVALLQETALTWGIIMTLDQVAIGEEVRITKVGGAGELRCRLLDMGLIPRTVVQVRKMAPMGDPIEIHLRGYELTLRKEDARKIEVERSV